MNSLALKRKNRQFVLGRGRLGGTICNGLRKAGVTLCDSASSASVVWFCLPERLLITEAEKLSRVVPDECFFIHTSGLLPAETIRIRNGLNVASLHPARSFPHILPEIPKDILWTFEGDGETKPLLSTLVRVWGGKWLEIPSGTKTAYHIACVLLGNLVDVPVDAAEKICNRFGLPFGKIAESLLVTHISGCVNGAVLDNTTGPAARGDLETVEKEAEWLSENFPEQEELYRFLSAVILRKNR